MGVWNAVFWLCGGESRQKVKKWKCFCASDKMLAVTKFDILCIASALILKLLLFQIVLSESVGLNDA
ncbi:hypothetical protein HMPREF9370_1357 [Neisseria wadsworthii 9715]|uniref:Uncharacterized protein n=1 Tax=Neisseria wadsworthii 9715 TaxID=1030841 RepID=G4CQJ7_9NEIS|nr:hypothetical protein HMPREF9370_1357 [Neisseria wadsworthii 9715]